MVTRPLFENKPKGRKLSEVGSSTERREGLNERALIPIEVMVVGIETYERELQPWKAEGPMLT